MRYLSVCSGIEAATVAWEALGWQPVGFADIEAFPRAVLAARHNARPLQQGVAPSCVPLWGDFTAIRPRHFRRLGIPMPELLVGGTPCQDFSIAGQRAGLSGARGNLSLDFVRLAHAFAAAGSLRTVLWENVPGVLSDRSNAFGHFLGALVGADAPLCVPCGRSWPDAGMVAGPRARAAWRVLDAQYFELAQHRRRVFLVADLGGGADPAAVLFEPQSLCGDSPPRREAGTCAAALTSHGVGTCGADDNQAQAGHLIAFGGNRSSGPIDVAPALNAHGGGARRMDFESEAFVAHALRAEGFDASEDGSGRGTPIVPVAFNSREDPCCTGDVTGALGSSTPQAQAVAFDMRGREGGSQFEGPHDTANIRAASGGSSRSCVAEPEWGVRRLTPRECERLQGFLDDYTLISYRGKSAADGPRYKALGNSMAVNVMGWIGRRIQMAEGLSCEA